MQLFFDIETSGFLNKKLSPTDPKQAWAMEVAYILSDKKRTYVEFSSLVTSNGRSCNPHAQKVHQITTAACDLGGISEPNVLGILLHGFFSADLLIAHNLAFDIEFIDNLIRRCGNQWDGLRKIPTFCTMKTSTNLCQLPFPKWKSGQAFKWPKLTELYRFLFDEDFEGAHGALADVRATRRCYYRLLEVL